MYHFRTEKWKTTKHVNLVSDETIKLYCQRITFRSVFILTHRLSPSAAGGPRESGRADQQGRESALLRTCHTVEPFPGRRCAQPPHPVLPGPGAPHAQGKSGGNHSHFIRGALTQFFRRLPSSPEFLPSSQSKDDAFKFSQQQPPTRKYKNTTRGQHGFITVGILFFTSNSLRSDYCPISFRSVFEAVWIQFSWAALNTSFWLNNRY